MHREAAAAAQQTDSMRMFLEGVEGGKPGEGQVGQQPEWFYKGDGSSWSAPAMRSKCLPSRRMAARTGTRGHLSHRPRRHPASARPLPRQRVFGSCDRAS